MWLPGLNSCSVAQLGGLGRLMDLGEMCPGGCHLRHWLVTHREVVRLLIILHAPSLEHRATLERVIPELALRRRLEVRMIAPQLIVRVDLIQSVLITEELILGEADIITLRIEFVGLFRREVLTPTPGVVPMMVLQVVLVFLRYDSAVLQPILVAHELTEVAALVSTLEVSDQEVGLSHLLLFF